MKWGDWDTGVFWVLVSRDLEASEEREMSYMDKL